MKIRAGLTAAAAGALLSGLLIAPANADGYVTNPGGKSNSRWQDPKACYNENNGVKSGLPKPGWYAVTTDYSCRSPE